MSKLTINHESIDEHDLADFVRHIASQIEKGFTSGYESSGTWDLTDTDFDEPLDEDDAAGVAVPA
jgi:hypothetical protein